MSGRSHRGNRIARFSPVVVELCPPGRRGGPNRPAHQLRPRPPASAARSRGDVSDEEPGCGRIANEIRRVAGPAERDSSSPTRSGYRETRRPIGRVFPPRSSADGRRRCRWRRISTNTRGLGLANVLARLFAAGCKAFGTPRFGGPRRPAPMRPGRHRQHRPRRHRLSCSSRWGLETGIDTRKKLAAARADHRRRSVARYHAVRARSAKAGLPAQFYHAVAQAA